MSFWSRTFLPDTWFDFKRDILYVSWQPDGDFCLTHLRHPDVSRVERLALFDELDEDWQGGLGQENNEDCYENYEELLCEILLVFSHLKKLTVVTRQGHRGGRKQAELVFRKREDYLGLIDFRISIPRLWILEKRG